jgi:hypothetical protein
MAYNNRATTISNSPFLLGFEALLENRASVIEWLRQGRARWFPFWSKLNLYSIILRLTLWSNPSDTKVASYTTDP